MSHDFSARCRPYNDRIRTTAYTPTISDRSLMSYLYYMFLKVLTVVLKLPIFSSMIAWKMSNRLWTKNITLWKSVIIMGQKLSKNGNTSLGSDVSAYWLT